MTIKMVPVVSSNILAIGYDDATQTMRVFFHKGKAHDFSGVPSERHVSFMRANSYGKFFAQNVKGKYPSAPVLLPTTPPKPDL